MNTPDSSLPPLVPDGPRRKMLIEIEVPADFERWLEPHLDGPSCPECMGRHGGLRHGQWLHRMGDSSTTGGKQPPADVALDVAAVHAWAARLPWWLLLLVSPRLPTYPEPKRKTKRPWMSEIPGTGGMWDR